MENSSFIKDNFHLPTIEEIETLIIYLPPLYAEGFSIIYRKLERGSKNEDDSITLPYPNYHPLVYEFFRHDASDGWLDYQYKPKQANEMLCDENGIETASLEQIQTMLMFCKGVDCSSDGHWEEIINKGYIRRLLERLSEIRSEQLT